MTENNEVFGRPVKGTITMYNDAIKEQHDPALFIEALDKLLAFPGVTAVRWTQDTPSWNDGEPCNFSPNEGTVSLGAVVEDDEELETEEGRWYGEGDEVFMGEYDMYTYDENENKVWKVGGIETSPELHAAVKEFTAVLDNGHHYVFLQTSFGDPAEITATPDGFEVDSYEGSY